MLTMKADSKNSVHSSSRGKLNHLALAAKVADIFIDYSSVLKLYATYASLYEHVAALSRVYAPREQKDDEEVIDFATTASKFLSNLFSRGAIQKPKAEEVVPLSPFLNQV